MRTVWILGAGFSQSLGGPLLVDLLSRESADKLRSQFPEVQELQTPACQLARALYLYGTKDDHRRSENGERQWQDVEEFLDMLDAAVRPIERDRKVLESPPPQWQWFDRLIKRVHALELQPAGVKEGATVEAVRNGARRLLAAECAAFTLNADLDTERWAPFADWLKYLDHEDTIVTFNYDRVIERLREDGSLRVHFVLPRGTDAARSRMNVLDPEQTNVLKLHGSVDWRRVVDDSGRRISFERSDDARFCVHCSDKELAIASPGPSKRKATEEFLSLWMIALEQIEAADRIVFVGYRFPPTDSEARNALLGAVNKNQWAKGGIHTVLGPNVHSDTSVRLRGLLQAVQQQTPMQHPMYAEDFVGLVPTLLPHDPTPKKR